MNTSLIFTPEAVDGVENFESGTIDAAIVMPSAKLDGGQPGIQQKSPPKDGISFSFR